MIRKLIAICTLIAASAMATPQVIFTVSDATGATQTTGQFIAGATHTVIFRLSDGAWDDTAVYSLVIKPEGQYTASPYVLIAGSSFDASGADLSVDVDLNIEELFTYLGRANARSVMLQLSDASSAYIVRRRIMIENAVRRPDDTPPAAPDENTYTDTEVDAMIDAIPAGLEPVPDPIDGWTVECTDEGQLRTSDTAAVELLRLITSYTETTTLASTDRLVIWDASEQAHRYITMSTLITYIISQLP